MHGGTKAASSCFHAASRTCPTVASEQLSSLLPLCLSFPVHYSQEGASQQQE